MDAGQRSRELREEKEQDSHAMGAVWQSQLQSRCSSCGFPSSRINVYNASIVDLLQFVFFIFLDN